MDIQADLPYVPQQREVFIYLLCGLQTFLTKRTFFPPTTLRQAFNALSFALPNQFPKTFHSLIMLCHQPLATWYPYNDYDEFNPSSPVLYDGSLSDEAKEFYFAFTEHMQLSSHWDFDLSQDALDNRKMSELRHRLKTHLDPQAAQKIYVELRSFLIEHSWAEPNDLRSNRALFHELREFYDAIPMPLIDDLRVCDRCGLLEWRDGQWHGIKPEYCSDHGSGSSMVKAIPNVSNSVRLKRAIHQRVFLPGRIERALFNIADELQDDHAQFLQHVERYPGIDTYDLRLTFSDGEVWAIDAKDQARPDRLAKSIVFPYSEGGLAYTHVFYVIPDERVREPGYLDTLEHHVNLRSPNLYIASLSEFQQHLTEKLKLLAHPPRRRKGKRV